MAGSFLSILIAISAAVCSQLFMGVYVIFGLIGSASFGKKLHSRVLSRIGAFIMVAALACEFWLFQILCRPALQWRLTGAVLAGLVLWSFFMTAFTDPGTPDSPEWETWCAKHASAPINDDIKKEAQPKAKKDKAKTWAPGETCQCDKCQILRPERSHHCKTCGTCVLRMDHHCPLIGNCVGWRNHKYYVLLQWWQFWGCVVFLFAPGGPGEFSIYGETYSLVTDFCLYLGISWAAVVMIIAGRSFAVATFMASRNETHIETHYFGGNPYKLESRMDNLRQLLGPLDIKLLLPVKAQRTCQGTSFPTEPHEKHPVTTSAKGASGFGSDVAKPYGTV